MARTSLAPPSTRFERGIALAQDRFEEIGRVAPWIWSVPSCSGEQVRHTVNLKASICSCPDDPPGGRRGEAGERCKHETAARYVKARIATCTGCGGRFRHRDLVELHEYNHDDLTHFHGDLLCRKCADAAGVLY